LPSDTQIVNSKPHRLSIMAVCLVFAGAADRGAGRHGKARARRSRRICILRYDKAIGLRKLQPTRYNVGQLPIFHRA
jgi:hypothetical protein